MTPIEIGLVYLSTLTGIGLSGYLPMFFRKIKKYFDELGNDDEE
tara:strand:+ start:146 stop:277 length:132 start_codon:yes stop_codon:yes gene_type:complete